jgi:cyclase
MKSTMQRTTPRGALLSLALLSLASLALPVAAQQDFSKVEIQTIKVTDGIYMLTGAGGNLGVCSGEDGIFLIDDQYAPLTEKIRAAIGKISQDPIRFVLNTHWHGDHTGGNENLGKSGTLIVAHDNVRQRMSTEQFIKFFGSKSEPSPKVALPVVTFNDTITLHLNGEEIHAFHVPPAHTDGDSAVYFRKANVIHMGDLYFAGMYPFIDGSSGGDISGMILAADKVLELINEETKVIPGHGALSNRAELASYREMLATVRDRVAKLVAAGKSAEEIVAAKPTADLDAVWGQGFIKPDQFVGIVLDALRD